MPKKGSSTIKINVRKHDVTITDELLVKICHNKDCKRPCPDAEKIVEYLEDELFLAEGYMVNEE